MSSQAAEDPSARYWSIASPTPSFTAQGTPQGYSRFAPPRNGITRKSPGLFDDQLPSGWQSNISPAALARYKQLEDEITDEDLFFHVYSVLHSPQYRSTFAADLKKSLPRIPPVETAEAFWAFSKAGRDLADLHLNYEDVEPWPDLKVTFADDFDRNDPVAWRKKSTTKPP